MIISCLHLNLLMNVNMHDIILFKDFNLAGNSAVFTLFRGFATDCPS